MMNRTRIAPPPKRIAPVPEAAEKPRAKKKRRRRKKRASFFSSEARFATNAIKAIAVTTAIFIAAQYVSFLITGQEQAVLIEWYFNAVVIECGAMMAKRIVEVIGEKIVKKLGLRPQSEEIDESEEG